MLKQATMQKFSRSEAIKFGWETTKANFWFWAGVLLTVFLVPFVINFSSDALPESPAWLYWIPNLISQIMGFGLSLGLVKISLMFVDGKKPTYSDLFSMFKPALIVKYFVGGVLLGLAVFFGFLLLIVPGIYFFLKYQFYQYFLVDQNSGILESFSKSGRITSGVKISLFVLGLTFLAIILLGAVALLVGLLWALPTVTLATAYVYRKLQSQEPSVNPVPLPAI